MAAAKCPDCGGSGCKQCVRNRPVDDGHKHRQRYEHNDGDQGSLFGRTEAGRQNVRKR